MARTYVCTLAACAAWALAAGCASNDDATAIVTETGTGGSGGAASCPPGAHATPAGCASSLTGWSAGTSLAQKRDHHATFAIDVAAGKFLYALAGVDDMTTLLGSTERAPIHADGTLGAWEPMSNGPAGMAGLGVAVVGDHVVVAGGLRANFSTTVDSPKSEIAPIQSDGSLGAWTEGPLMSAGRFHGALIGAGDSVYAVGGMPVDGDNTPSVDRAVVADGTLGAWTPVTPLPAKRSHHGLAVHEGALYVVGGLSGDPAGAPTPYDDVLRAPIEPDGTLGAWAQVGTLAVPVEVHASFAHLGYLYVVAGVENNASDTAHVRRAPIAGDGTVGAWESLPDLPKPRAHCHQTPLIDGFLYVVGGAVNHASLPDVTIGAFE